MTHTYQKTALETRTRKLFFKTTLFYQKTQQIKQNKRTERTNEKKSQFKIHVSHCLPYMQTFIRHIGRKHRQIEYKK